MSTLETGSGRTRIRFSWQRHGNDLHVHVSGGDDHIGAAALVGRHPGGALSEGVLPIPPHKEDRLVLDAARTLHAVTGVNVCVTAGIHLDEISPGEIDAVLRNVDQGVALLAAKLQAIQSA